MLPGGKSRNWNPNQKKKTPWNPLGHSSPVTGLLYLFFLSFMHYGMRLFFNHVMYFRLPKIVCILLKINLHSFCVFWVYFKSLVFCKLFATKWVITLTKDADVCGSFIGAIWRWTLRFCCTYMYWFTVKGILKFSTPCITFILAIFQPTL